MMNTSVHDLRQRLESFVAAQTRHSVTITALDPLPGGASRETWAVDLTIDGGSDAGSHQLVLRRDLGSSMNPEALSRAQEFCLLHVAYDRGVLVPQVKWLCTDPQVIGAPFLLMQRIAGESIGARVVRKPELADARSTLTDQMAEQLARIHAIDLEIDGVRDLPRPAADQTSAQHALAGVRRAVDQLGLGNPAITFALRWLDQHAPASVDHTLVHGDFRIGNLLVCPNGLSGVIDWEFAHLGDPHEDLAWPCVRDWRFGVDQLRVGGVGDLDHFLAAYEAASGRPVDRAAVRWWEIAGNLRWSVTCAVQAERHLSGSDPSLEYASLGRRAAEMELEYLLLIGAET